MAHAFHRFALAILGLALPVALVAYGGNGDSRKAAPLAPKAERLGTSNALDAYRRLKTSLAEDLGDGAPIPEQYTCKGANIAPPLTWSAPFGGALVVDDPDAPREPYVHWIVIGIAPGAGSTADGETPGGGISLPNSSGQPAYTGPCPPAGTGTHHYRFTLYHLPAVPPLAGLAGTQAARVIAQAATMQARLIGTYEG
ncbi:phosphatidylethanolamine-binding protein [Mycobacterium tuberculosis str. Beijing/NITR203]|nr:phosphatidylethanolamine-binding protein [Mycobacterium tuberculosis str. Beijing/NITR203]